MIPNKVVLDPSYLEKNGEPRKDADIFPDHIRCHPSLRGKIEEILAESQFEFVEEKENMPTNWFGKGCPHLCAQWETEECESGTDYQEYEPAISYCSHKDNPKKHEGNCLETICPLFRKT